MLLVSKSISAQCFDYYRQTPLGSNIKACSADYPDWYVQEADAQTRTYAIEVLESGTDSYNCHAYAWHVKDGGDKVWINNFENEIHNIDNYWLDHSYVATSFLSGVPNLKVFYGSTSPSSDHTAITTSDPNIFISKMGCGALVRHYKNNSPYDNSNLTYYKLNFSISGSSQVCDQATYTINLPAGGTTVEWSAIPLNIVTIQQNGNSATLTKVGSGLITLSAKVNNSITVTKDIWVGLQASFSGSASVNYLKTGTWYSNASCGAEPYIYQWWLRKANSGVASMCVSNDPEITLRSVAQGTAKLAQSAKPPIVNQPVSYTIFYMFLRVTDASGFQYDTPEQQIYAYGKVDLVPALLLRMTDSVQVSDVDQVNSMEVFPNPASSEVQISINKASSASLKAVSSNISNNSQNSYYVNVVDIYGSIVFTDTKVGELFTIPISTLRNGVYNVIVSDGTNTYQNKLIVKH